MKKASRITNDQMFGRIQHKLDVVGIENMNDRRGLREIDREVEGGWSWQLTNLTVVCKSTLRTRLL